MRVLLDMPVSSCVVDKKRMRITRLPLDRKA
jgi:hypothetical protein